MSIKIFFIFIINYRDDPSAALKQREANVFLIRIALQKAFPGYSVPQEGPLSPHFQWSEDVQDLIAERHQPHRFQQGGIDARVLMLPDETLYFLSHPRMGYPVQRLQLCRIGEDDRAEDLPVDVTVRMRR